MFMKHSRTGFFLPPPPAPPYRMSEENNLKDYLMSISAAVVEINP